jgi:hypothetical protein
MKFANAHSALRLLAPRSFSEVGCGEKLKPKRSLQRIDSHVQIAEGALSNDFQKYL